MNWARLKIKWLPQTRDGQGLLVALLFSLSVLILLPLAAILYFSFVLRFPVLGPVEYTTANYSELFVENFDTIVSITENTVIFSVGSVALSLSIGLTAAILAEKYLQRTRLRMLMLLPYAMPSVAGLTGWIFLLGNNGLINQFLRRLFGLAEPPLDIYTLWGMIFVDGLHIAPLAFLLLTPAIRSISAEIEEASFVDGASIYQTFRRINIPLIMPSIISVSIFLIARSMAVVTAPSVLGVPKSIFTYGSAIPFLFLRGTDLSYTNALTFSVFLMAISAAMMAVYFRFVSKESKYTTVGGQSSGKSKKYEVGRLGRWAAVSFFAVYIFVGGFLPLLAIVWDSVITTFTFTLDPSKFTIENYVVLLSGNAEGAPAWWRALGNTVIVGAITPTVAVLLSLLISYSHQSLKIPFAGVLSYLASVPLAIPAISLGLGYLVVFIRTPLYGTLGILVVAFIGRAIPIAMRYSSPALIKIGIENVEASQVSGYHELRTFRKVILPLVSSDFVAAWMHIFVFVIRNVPIAILLYAAGSEVVAVELLFAIQGGYFKTASSMAVILTVLSVGPYLFLQYWRMQKLRQRSAAAA